MTQNVICPSENCMWTWRECTFCFADGAILQMSHTVLWNDCWFSVSVLIYTWWMTLFICGTRVLTYIIVTEDLCTSEVLCISPCVLCDYLYLANSLLNHRVLSLFSFNFFLLWSLKCLKRTISVFFWWVLVSMHTMLVTPLLFIFVCI